MISRNYLVLSGSFLHWLCFVIIVPRNVKRFRHTRLPHCSKTKFWNYFPFSKICQLFYPVYNLKIIVQNSTTKLEFFIFRSDINLIQKKVWKWKPKKNSESSSKINKSWFSLENENESWNKRNQKFSQFSVTIPLSNSNYGKITRYTAYNFIYIPAVLKT